MPKPRQRGDKWQARANIGNGHYRTRTFDTYEQARVWTTRTEADHSRGVLPDTTVTWGELRHEWVESRRHIRTSTQHTYEQALDRTDRWDDMPVARITAGHIEDLLHSLTRPDGQPLAPATLSSIYRAVISGVITRAMRYGYITHNPLIGVEWPSVPAFKGARYLTVDEVDAVADQLDGIYRNLFIFLPYTGLRIGEAMGLQGDDIRNGRVSVTKQLTSDRRLSPPKNAASIREVPLAGKATQVLPHVDPKWLWAEAGKPQPPSHRWVSVKFKEAAERAQVEPFRVHDLRHTCASWLIGAGANIVHVSRWLGHARVTQTLDTYAHLMPDELDGLAGLL